MSKNEWFVMQKDMSQGPFTYEEMIQLKQNKKLFDHDYVWCQHLSGWTRVGFIDELRLSSETPHLVERRHPRYQVGLDCYVSNPEYAYPGAVRSLSQGGALIEAQHPHFEIGQDVYVLTKPTDLGHAGFVKRGRIANKQFIPNKVQFKSSCLYIVTFNHEDPSVVKSFTE